MPRKNKHSLVSMRRPWWLLGLGLPLLLLAGCQDSMAVLTPASPGAARIADLTWQIFWIALVVFIVVEGLLLYVIIRFRHRGEREEPRQVHGHTRMEIAWTTAPALVLVVVFVLTVQTMYAVATPPDDTMDLRVVGHQWWWEVRYPDLGITTANEIRVPVGEAVRVELLSFDVIHSFWVPELGGKMDLIPGHTNWTWFQTEQEGEFYGMCTEFCGVQHANMGFIVVVQSPEEFAAWVENEKSDALPPASDLAREGEQAFLTSGCGGCHTVAGTRAQGVIGPNLTHMGSRRTLAANVFPNTPENMARWLADPQEVKPGNLMRTPPLSDETVRQLTAYLEGLK